MARFRYDKGDINSALAAAVKATSNGGRLYVVATYHGFAVTRLRPPKGQAYYLVEDGNAELIKGVTHESV